MKSQNKFTCLTCKDFPSVNHNEFVEHMKTVHGIAAASISGTRTFLMHADAQDYYEYLFKWEVGGIEFTQHLIEPRRRVKG